MPLLTFISNEADAIVADWVAQARRLGVRAFVSESINFEDSARRLLDQIVLDLKQEQSATSRDAKGIGRLPENAPGMSKIAQEHADDRLSQGYSINDLVAEYRALRASVTRQWLEADKRETADEVGELIRFNESIDQALTESVAHYSGGLAQARDLFVGVLAHDLRTPLGAIAMAGQYLLKVDNAAAPIVRTGLIIQRSSARMKRIISDLLDFTSTRLGGKLLLRCGDENVGNVCRQAIAEIEALHPGEIINWTSAGNLSGVWDGSRLGQLMTNLLENAIDHGKPGAAIAVHTDGTNDHRMLLSVTNEGPPIPVNVLSSIFDPLKRGGERSQPRKAGAGLGLGLFIAKQVAIAHGGTITVTSDLQQTQFMLSLPRRS